MFVCCCCCVAVIVMYSTQNLPAMTLSGTCDEYCVCAGVFWLEEGQPCVSPFMHVKPLRYKTTAYS